MNLQISPELQAKITAYNKLPKCVECNHPVHKDECLVDTLYYDWDACGCMFGVV